MHYKNLENFSRFLFFTKPPFHQYNFATLLAHESSHQHFDNFQELPQEFAHKQTPLHHSYESIRHFRYFYEREFAIGAPDNRSYNRPYAFRDICFGQEATPQYLIILHSAFQYQKYIFAIFDTEFRVVASNIPESPQKVNVRRELFPLQKNFPFQAYQIDAFG